MAKAQTKNVTAATNEAPAQSGRKTVEITDKLLADYATFNGQNKSTTIRGLAAMGYDRGQIAKVMNIRYQHVRNVLITPVKRPVTKAE